MFTRSRLLAFFVLVVSFILVEAASATSSGSSSRYAWFSAAPYIHSHANRNIIDHRIFGNSKRQDDGGKLLIPCAPADTPEEVIKAGQGKAAPSCPLAEPAGKRSLLSSLFRARTVPTRPLQDLSAFFNGNTTIEKRDKPEIQKWYETLGENNANLQVPADQARVFFSQPKRDSVEQANRSQNKHVSMNLGVASEFTCSASSIFIITSPFAAIMIHLGETQFVSIFHRIHSQLLMVVAFRI
jgi:hypothetical protein